MSDKQYIYAVARIRSKELSLFGTPIIEQLLSTKSYDECLRLLADKGWGDGAELDAQRLLALEREKTWELIGELVDDLSPFDVFLYTNDYHNLKAAIKLVCTGATDDGTLFISHGTLNPKEILDAVRERDFYALPAAMREPAQEAYAALSQTHDGQLCDMILDRAALEAVYETGKASGNDLIELYAELTVASADIKTAIRCSRTGKSLDFIRRALAPCDTLNVNMLAQAASEGRDSICDYLSTTDYSEGVPALQQSASAFERWCDNFMIRQIRPQQYKSFGIGPLAAYILGRENEIKSVRIILSGKLNGLPDASVRERIREMYV